MKCVQFYTTGNNKDERPVGLGTYGEAYFISEERGDHPDCRSGGYASCSPRAVAWRHPVSERPPR